MTDETHRNFGKCLRAAFEMWCLAHFRGCGTYLKQYAFYIAKEKYYSHSTTGVHLLDDCSRHVYLYECRFMQKYKTIEDKPFMARIAENFQKQIRASSFWYVRHCKIDQMQQIENRWECMRLYYDIRRKHVLLSYEDIKSGLFLGCYQLHLSCGFGISHAILYLAISINKSVELEL